MSEECTFLYDDKEFNFRCVIVSWVTGTNNNHITENYKVPEDREVVLAQSEAICYSEVEKAKNGPLLYLIIMLLGMS